MGNADVHCLGNGLFAPGDPRPRVIDWSDLFQAVFQGSAAWFRKTAAVVDARAALAEPPPR